MTYSDAWAFLEASKQLGSKPGLERVSRLCALLGGPQDAVPAVHVAGTNGKGSTSAMIASVLRAAGYKTGLYTSPYFHDFRECVQIDGEPMGREDFTEIANEIQEIQKLVVELKRGEASATEFELETAMAFLWFKQSGCTAEVIEAGMGGRLDATNVLARPLVSVITSISLDHTAYLGDTVEAIAREKCGILKPGSAAVSYPVQPGGSVGVIRESAAKVGVPLSIPDMGTLRVLSAGLDGTEIEYRELRLKVPFVGKHQALNAATAVEALLVLRERCDFHMTDGDIERGIRAAKLPLRQEILNREPVVLIDGAHNPDGLSALSDTIQNLIAPRRTAVVMGMLSDKDWLGSVALIAPLCGKFIATKPVSPRALAGEPLAEAARAYCADVSVQDGIEEALREALAYAGEDGAVVVCGSLYLAAPAREAFLKMKK